MTRKKFVPLLTESGAGNRMVALLPGRHPCQCLAARHRLIGNCISCGRIVCEQEGSGSCYFCGNLVMSPEEKEFVDRDANAASKYIAKLRSVPFAADAPPPPWTINRKLHRQHGNRSKCKPGTAECPEDDPENPPDDSEPEADIKIENETENDFFSDVDAQARFEEGLVKALIQRDRLLQFDATTTKRTRVIDDEVDYFVSDYGGGGGAALWLDPQTRARVTRRVEELRAKKYELRSQAAIALTVDFSNKTVSEQVTRSVQSFPTGEDLALLAPSDDSAISVGISDPYLNVPVPQFIPQNGVIQTTIEGRVRSSGKEGKQQSRVQDVDQQKIVDRGFCLSMHQPYASLLVRGVKIHEGRSWYSAHRGPLWIAAAAKQPDKEVISAVEDDYLKRGARRADFPASYPVGVLVGCVNVDDVLPQKEYRLKFPNGESESPYVFICSDPRELVIKLPMSGQHKIYRLDARIHAAAKVNLT
ncbi:hypothetical protein Aperf_G00000019655 [Anoplocephala perfoliata]